MVTARLEIPKEVFPGESFLDSVWDPGASSDRFGVQSFTGSSRRGESYNLHVRHVPNDHL